MSKYYKLGMMAMVLFLLSCNSAYKEYTSVGKAIKQEVLSKAENNLKEKPATVTSFIAERSAGGKHDFFSEGDYWWPDTLNLEGPYVRRDGESNPDNFVDHRRAMIRFSSIVANLTSAYLITGNRKYADHALSHVRAWFVNEKTRMNPSLLYAQAIKGISTGRGIGIIDTIHLIEVAQSLLRLEQAGILITEDAEDTKKWFAEYLKWMSTHPYGIDEMNADNNHGTCWVMQAAMFAKYAGDKNMMKFCSERYKTVLLKQMADDGSFPRETGRTKPYAYSLFNLDAMATICKILSSREDNLWKYTSDDGKSIRKGIEFLYPFVTDKMQWPYVHDVMYWDEWPVAHPFLLFWYNQTRDEKYLNTWLALEHFPENEEVIRNLPIRNPYIWMK